MGLFTKGTTVEDVKSSPEVMEDIDIEADDDELLSRKIDFRVKEAQASHDKRVKLAQRNLKIFRGKIDELETNEKTDFNSDVVLSRVFFIIRNLVGLSTDNPPHVIVAPDTDNAKSIKKAKKIEQNLEWGGIRTNFNDTIAMCLFDTWIKSDSYLHWFWNYDINDFDVEPYTVENTMLSADASDIDDSEFVILMPFRNRQWFKKNYPEQYPEIEFDSRVDDTTGSIIETTDRQRGTLVRVYSYWENDVLVMKVRSKSTGSQKSYIILEKKKNPYYEYRTPEEQMAEEGIQQEVDPMTGLMPEESIMAMEEFIPITNYFQFARKPIVQIPSIKLLGEQYSEDILSHVFKVFMSMNNKKRAYNDNLAGCNNKIIVDSNAVAEEESDKITNEPNQVIRADFNENAKPIYTEQGTTIPNDFHKDIYHDEQYIDDVFGHHDISRGSGNADTLGQDQMNAESDRTPVRYQVRATERGIVEVTQGWIQLMKMFYTEPHYAKKFTQDDSVDMIELINDDVEEGVAPLIKPASSMPISKEGRKRQAVEMFGAGALDPYTMFAQMDIGNPEELAQRLTNWLNFGVVDSGDPEEIKADMMAQDGTQGDVVDNPVERANSENLTFQEGKEVPPTPPELLSPEHVKLHIGFANDPEQKMEQEDRDGLLAHAEADKAGLVKMMAGGMVEQAQEVAETPESANIKA